MNHLKKLISINYFQPNDGSSDLKEKKKANMIKLHQYEAEQAKRKLQTVLWLIGPLSYTDFETVAVSSEKTNIL